MSIIFSYIRVFVFLGCTMVGVQVPMFVEQYGKSLESHLAESRNALKEFQDDADKYFDGSIEKLIAHYKKDEDQIFKTGGCSIQSIYDRNVLLSKKSSEFRSGSWAAYTQALFTPVRDVKKDVWKNYSYAVLLSPESIAFGLVTGLISTIAIELFLNLFIKILKLRNPGLQTTP